jgi:NADH-quinone oxidoreductase subunit M
LIFGFSLMFSFLQTRIDFISRRHDILYCSSFLIYILLLCWYNFDKLLTYQQQYHVTSFFHFSYDGVSLLFLLLTITIFPTILLAAWDVIIYVKELFIFLFLTEIFLIIVFLMVDIFSFYIFFELLLFPMIYLIGFWGTRERRIKASYYFFLYTVGGSLLMLYALILIYFESGSTNFFFLSTYCFGLEKQKIIWFLFFIPFAIKIPMYPFHIWLPEAHVEASTLGSIILAALLLKLGSYGFFRILCSLFVDALYYFLPLIMVLITISILYSSLILLRQIDMKRIVAYSSVAHMNFGLLGFFSSTVEGMEGGLYLMFSHGYSSAALFYCVGILYERFHTRLLHYYSGFVLIMPVFMSCFIFMILANFGFPGTANFIGEFLILLGVLSCNNRAIILALIAGLILSLIYSILFYNRISFGEIRLEQFQFNYYSDISEKEFNILIIFIFYIIFFGIIATPIFEILHASVLCNIF